VGAIDEKDDDKCKIKTGDFWLVQHTFLHFFDITECHEKKIFAVDH